LTALHTARKITTTYKVEDIELGFCSLSFAKQYFIFYHEASDEASFQSQPFDELLIFSG